MTTSLRWRCSVCGCSWKAAQRQRRRRGLSALRRDAVVCTPDCRHQADLRRDRARRGPESTRPPRLPRGWRCAGCGCTAAAAERRRRLEGRWQQMPTARTCSRACRLRAEWERRAAAWFAEQRGGQLSA